jgi:hypothetical protein
LVTAASPVWVAPSRFASRATPSTPTSSGTSRTSSRLSVYPGALLRGLFHSDGCRVANWATRTVAGEVKRYEYGRWQFVNHSTDIQRFCTDALDRLDIPWRQSSWKSVSVSRREAVARLDAIVGPKS